MADLGKIAASLPGAGVNFVSAFRAAKEAEIERAKRAQEDMDKQQQRAMQNEAFRVQNTPVAPASTFYPQAPADLQLTKPEVLKALQDQQAMKAKQETATQKPSIFQQQADREAAKGVNKWVFEGGSADAERGLQGIGQAIQTLESDQNIGGPVAGRIPDFLRGLTPSGRNTLNTRQVIENEVQRSLRATLGAQFTEKEGERLIKRAYDETLTAQENIPRLRRLYTAMQRAKQAKDALAAYALENGTTQGYQGPVFSENMTADQLLETFGDGGGQPLQMPPVQMQGPGWRIVGVE